MVKREPFDWLADPRCRRSALRDVQAAVRRGWFDGPGPILVERRAALLAVLGALLDDPSLRPLEFLRLSRIFTTMGMRDLEREIRKLREST